MPEKFEMDFPRLWIQQLVACTTAKHVKRRLTDMDIATNVHQSLRIDTHMIRYLFEKLS